MGKSGPLFNPSYTEGKDNREEAATAGLRPSLSRSTPSPQVYSALDRAGPLGFLEVYQDLETALASFQ